MAIAVLHLDVHAGFSSGGSLSKTWSADRRWLYKGASSEATMIRICSEYLCSQFAAALGIEHVTYEWMDYKYQISDSPEILNLGLVRCKNFISEGTQFISFYEIFKQQNKSLSDTLADFAGRYTDDFCKMLMFDYLIANTDRHHKNFGVLFSRDGTQKMAPLFDHDWALFPEWCEGSFVFEQAIGSVCEKTYLQTLDALLTHIKEIHEDPKSLMNWEAFRSRKDKIIASCPKISLKRKICLSAMLDARMDKLLSEIGG